MKLLPLAVALLGLGGGVASVIRSEDPVVILTGDTRGYLSPCGCTEPMIGGIRRRVTAIRSLSVPGSTTILDSGALIDGVGRQDQIKAETLAEVMGNAGVSAINVAPEDARLGSGYLSQVAQLSGGKMTTLSIRQPEAHGVAAVQASGRFLIGGVTTKPNALAAALGDVAVPPSEAVRMLIGQATELQLVPILLLQGSHAEAVDLARQFPGLALIQYSSVGTPPNEIEHVGRTAIVTAGDHGKYVLKVVYRNGQFDGYRRVPLSPVISDDPTASRLYDTYLRRVRRENLIAQTPRHETESFAGSWACMPCHQEPTRVWKNSHHRFALETLIKEGHDADPDCVSCHVVGLESTKGFRTKGKTPQLAGVGCESCHGPALAHVKKPTVAKMRKITPQACVGCHNGENSPNFDFDAYWRKIAH